jgi:hypothetical protein
MTWKGKTWEDHLDLLTFDLEEVVVRYHHTLLSFPCLIPLKQRTHRGGEPERGGARGRMGRGAVARDRGQGRGAATRELGNRYRRRIAWLVFVPAASRLFSPTASHP